jgi:hypothetical protein
MKEVHRLLDGFTDDLLKQIPILPIGSHLEQDATYIDLAAVRREFTPTLGTEARPGSLRCQRARLITSSEQTPRHDRTGPDESRPGIWVRRASVEMPIRSCGRQLGDFRLMWALNRHHGGSPCDTATRSRTTIGPGPRTSCPESQASTARSPRTTASSSTPSSGSPGLAPRGATCPSGSATGTRSGGGSTAGPARGSGSGSSRPCKTPTWSG